MGIYDAATVFSVPDFLRLALTRRAGPVMAPVQTTNSLLGPGP